MKKALSILFVAALILTGCTKPEPFSTQTVAHRGFWKTEGSAQNSLAAIQKAGEIGVYGSEFDVNMTTDGVLVVNHDDTFYGFNIADTEYAVIKDSTLANGEVLPTLEEYLKVAQQFPDLKLVFELKSSRADSLFEATSIPKAIEMLKEYGCLERTDFISFSMTACQLFTKLVPGNPCEYLGGAMSPAEVKEAGLNAIDYHYTNFQKNPEWVKEAHDLGMIVNAWTVDDEETMNEMIALGVDFVTTNDPLLCEKLIKEYNEAKAAE